MNDIEEQDKVAKRILAGANETLSLELSEIANSQSDETVQQGRTLMVFTVTTILFLPMSFLTSLFALNITSFPHNRINLKYSPGWIFGKLFGVSVAIWVPSLLWYFRSGIWQMCRYWGRSGRQPPDEESGGR
ncbi:hypothetical protein DER46DRAFT_261193 [Fusarium sp. MPI-SDFR-AT-0072]|nr:hypothetical protein DER46DRAFT_261193 [Fusarium sp. MPI-SDFR-AT-0072]